MLRKFLITLMCLIVSCLVSTDVSWAGKKPKPPTAAERAQSFEDAFNSALTSPYEGSLDQFVSDTMTGGDAEQREMLTNMLDGKTARGEDWPEDRSRGYGGDPNDPGPSDWSDWNVETDANGNVTGFKEKDFDEKDADGDGEISDQEREDWNKKREKEWEENGGPPGEVDPTPDWDDDNDGIPNGDYVLDCWQCRYPPGYGDECHDGIVGPCDAHTCSFGQDCLEHFETHKDASYICHNCYDSGTVSWCEQKGYSSDPMCAGHCPPIACVGIDVDLNTGQIVPTNVTRERNSTHKCYTCMQIESIEITYVIIIIETPYGRVVLDRDKKSLFEPSTVMALAKVDQATGMLKNAGGQLQSVSDLMSSFTSGLGLVGLTSGGQIGMEQLAGLMQQSLNQRGSFGQDCFGEAVEQADQNAKENGQPTSQDLAGTSRERKKDKQRRDNPVFSAEQRQQAEAAGTPAVSGPIVACGNEGRDKVFKIYDGAGRLIDTITRDIVNANPSILLEKIGLAQKQTDLFMNLSGINFGSLLQKYTGLPILKVQEIAGRVSGYKAQFDKSMQLLEAKSKKKKKASVAEPIFPNDPLYATGPKPKKKKLLGFLGSTKQAPVGILSSGPTMGVKSIEAKKARQPDIKDQWGLHEVGFTSYDDEESAWNVIDAQQENVLVAVIDSGFDFEHEDRPQFVWTNPGEIADNGIDDDQNGFVDDIHGWNFLDENHDFTDIRGHGTFVAGIIAARTNNGKGIAGINPGAVIMPIKVADEEGDTNSLAIYRAITYAVNHGARVINVSLGSRTISNLEQQAIERAHQMGALVVVAAGNSNDDLMEFGPSSSDYALAVGQIDVSGVRSTVSNWGANLGLLAPGEQIYSLCSKDNKHVKPSIRQFGYYTQDGTSFSTPIVAATASLIWAKDAELTNDQIVDILHASADDMEEPGWDAKTGAGLLNAAAALRLPPQNLSRVMLTSYLYNTNTKDQLLSIDLYGTVRGPIKEFVIEAGKGHRAPRYKTISEPLTGNYNSAFITRIDVREHLRGSREWTLRLRATTVDGQERLATLPLVIQ